MARVLAISSLVARGHVGLSAIVPALQAQGHEVIGLPTILLSNHPGHARFAGERTQPDLLHRMLDALDQNGWLAGIDAVLTGYLPSIEHVDFALAALMRIREKSPRAIYLCDPILGDEPRGLYIAEAAADATAKHLVPIADVMKLNRFEANWLFGVAVTGSPDLAALITDRPWREIIVTSVPGDAPDELRNTLVSKVEGAAERLVRRRNDVPNGTGDLLSALYLGYRLAIDADAHSAFAMSVTALNEIVVASVGRDELQLVPNLARLRR